MKIDGVELAVVKQTGVPYSHIRDTKLYITWDKLVKNGLDLDRVRHYTWLAYIPVTEVDMEFTIGRSLYLMESVTGHKLNVFSETHACVLLPQAIRSKFDKEQLYELEVIPHTAPTGIALQFYCKNIQVKRKEVRLRKAKEVKPYYPQPAQEEEDLYSEIAGEQFV